MINRQRTWTVVRVSTLVLPLAVTACSSHARPTSRSSRPVVQPTSLGGGGEESSASRSSTIAPTPSKSSLSAGAAAGQVDGACPYLPAAVFSDAEGDLVGRVTVSRKRPVDCTFYFQRIPDQIVGEINVQTFATPNEAYHAVATSYGSQVKHPEVETPPFAVGDGAVLFKTELQGAETWQCVFYKGRTVYVVRTRQPSPALNAANIAKAMAARLH